MIPDLFQSETFQLLFQGALVISLVVQGWVIRRRTRRLVNAENAIATRDAQLSRLTTLINEERQKADLGPLGQLIDDIRRDRDRLAQENAKLRGILTGTKQPNQAAGAIHFFEKDIHGLTE